MLPTRAVCYEDFGAVGDGVADDFEAIRRAHDYANANGLPVVTHPTAAYYIGGACAEAVIMTDTDWGTSRFIIDDSKVPPEERGWNVFHVRSALEPVPLRAESLRKSQTRLEASLPCNAFVVAEDAGTRQFMRVGLNQSDGETQTDCFLVDQSGAILTPPLWDFKALTKLTAYPMDARVLTVKGGRFTTIANQAPSKYTYYARGLMVTRSKVVVDGVTHAVTGELDHGAPYRGFAQASDCAYVTFQNCHFTGHRIYSTIGSAQKPVTMGSYDVSVYRSFGVTFLNCTQDNIMDMTLWGVFGSNFCKDMVIDGCTFSRVDAHMGVTNYTIRNSVIGWMGLKAIGHGHMLVENVRVHSSEIVQLRMDYGSSWNGDLTLRNVTWTPAWRAEWKTPGALALITGTNTGDHDFGYPCSQPRRITIENVRVMDGDLQENRELCILLNTPDNNSGVQSFGQPAEGDAPYRFTSELTVRNLTAQSGEDFSIWSMYPENGYCDQKHNVRDGAFESNFRADIDGMDGLTVAAPETTDADYGDSHRLVPEVAVRNCGRLTVRPGACPMRVTEG